MKRCLSSRLASSIACAVAARRDAAALDSGTTIQPIS